VSDGEALHAELKELIVKTLALEDVTAAEIATDAPLFGDGLDLDSIDALEIAMVLEERYGVTLDDDSEENQRIFQSVRSIANFIVASREG
jgi:acyl carrier protein